MMAPTQTIRQFLYYFGDVRPNLNLEKKCPNIRELPKVTTQQWRLQRGAARANYTRWRISVRSEDFLRQLDIMAKDPRFSRLSILDLQNILTAIELCDLGFGSGNQVCEGLNQVLRDEWPIGSPGRRTP